MRLPAGCAGLAMLAIGCQTDLEIPPIIEASDHLVLRGYEPVCTGTFGEMEARVVAIQELFDAPPVQVTYNWIGEQTPEVECIPGAAACAWGQDIFALYLANEHELVHAARSRQLPGALEEGLAEFLGTGDSWDPFGTRDELRLAIESDQRGFSYTRASEFVQFLVQSQGFEPLIELAEHTVYTSEFEAWRPKFEEIYGQTWDAVWAAYLESPDCSSIVMTDDVYLCYSESSPIIDLAPTFPEPEQYLHDMDCASETVVGPAHGDELRHEIAVEFNDPFLPTLWVRVRGDIVSDSRVGLRYCGPCGETAAGVVLGEDVPLSALTVQPGRYVLELIQPANVGGQLGVEISY
jgi:hypothetical protein